MSLCVVWKKIQPPFLFRENVILILDVKQFSSDDQIIMYNETIVIIFHYSSIVND